MGRIGIPKQSRIIFLHLVEGPRLNVGVWDTDGAPGEEGRAPDERGKTADNTPDE